MAAASDSGGEWPQGRVGLAKGRADRPEGRADRRIALVVAFLALLVYNANLRGISTGDNFPARFVPLAVLHQGTVYLDGLLDATRMGHAKAYWVLAVRGRVASAYPLVTPLLVTPLYVPAVLYLDHRGWNVKRVQRIGAVMEKLAASCIAAACAGLMFWLLRRQMSRPRALLLVTAFALGTETWAISSQALWQHGTAELLIIVALLAATGPPTTKGLLLAGLASGLLIANRPPDALLAAAFAIHAPLWARPPRRALLFFAAAAVPIALTVGYDLISFGNLSGGYGYMIKASTSLGRFFRFPLWSGVAGELVSPGKGLFIYSPFLLWLPFLCFRYFRRRRSPLGETDRRRSAVDRRHSPEGSSLRPLAAGLLVGMTLLVLLYAKTDWRGGFSYGPRYLTDLVPALVWLLAPVVESLRGASFAAFAAACLFSIYVQVVGSFFYPGAGSDQLYYSGSFDSDDLTNIWKPGDAAFVVELRSGALDHLSEWRGGS
jgi:hypothetical protein